MCKRIRARHSPGGGGERGRGRGYPVAESPAGALEEQHEVVTGRRPGTFSWLIISLSHLLFINTERRRSLCCSLCPFRLHPFCAAPTLPSGSQKVHLALCRHLVPTDSHTDSLTNPGPGQRSMGAPRASASMCGFRLRINFERSVRPYVHHVRGGGTWPNYRIVFTPIPITHFISALKEKIQKDRVICFTSQMLKMQHYPINQTSAAQSPAAWPGHTPHTTPPLWLCSCHSVHITSFLTLGEQTRDGNKLPVGKDCFTH